MAEFPQVERIIEALKGNKPLFKALLSYLHDQPECLEGLGFQVVGTQSPENAIGTQAMSNIPGKHILDNAQVSGKARVSGNAKVYGSARVYGSAKIGGTAILIGGSWNGFEGEITSGKWKAPGVPA